MTAPLPRVPFEPLHRLVDARAIKTAWNPTGSSIKGGGALSSLGWYWKSWQATAYRRGQTTGYLPFTAADRLACDLGMHPAEIWGQAWWDAIGAASA